MKIGTFQLIVLFLLTENIGLFAQLTGDLHLVDDSSDGVREI